MWLEWNEGVIGNKVREVEKVGGHKITKYPVGHWRTLAVTPISLRIEASQSSY